MFNGLPKFIVKEKKENCIWELGRREGIKGERRIDTWEGRVIIQWGHQRGPRKQAGCWCESKGKESLPM